MSHGRDGQDSKNMEQNEGESSLRRQTINQESSNNQIQSQIWLSSYYNPISSNSAYSNCMTMSDVFGDNDHKLIVGNLDAKLSVYRNMILHSEIELLGVPSSVCSLYADDKPPILPVIAVSTGPNIYFYKNLKPNIQFCLPRRVLDEREEKAWSEISSQSITKERLYEILSELRSEGISLSSRSLDYLALFSSSDIDEFLAQVCSTPLVQLSSITCMTTLNKRPKTDNTTVSLLVIGTEDNSVLLMDCNVNTILRTFKLPSVPVDIHVYGSYELTYTIFILCRNNFIYLINDNKLTDISISLFSPIVDYCVLKEDIIIIGSNNQIISCYSFKGRELYNFQVPSDIVSIIAADLTKSRLTQLYIVALTNGDILTYHDRQMIDKISTQRKIKALSFGPYGRALSSLAVLHTNNGLRILMLRRTANLKSATEQTGGGGGPPEEQEIPIQIPKRTKLYLDIITRENENCINIYQIFNKEFMKFRYLTAKTFVELVKDNPGSQQSSSSSSNGGSGDVISRTVGGGGGGASNADTIAKNVSLSVSATVQGLGPLFKVKILLNNTGSSILRDLPILIIYNSNYYQIDNPFRMLPTVIVGVAYSIVFTARYLNEIPKSEMIYFFVLNKSSPSPILTVNVNMPVPEIF